MELMNKIPYTHNDKFATVYLDEILVYGKTMSEHFEHAKSVLSTLRNEKLFAKLFRCTFGASAVEHSRHRFASEDVRVDPQKIEATEK